MRSILPCYPVIAFLLFPFLNIVNYSQHPVIWVHIRKFIQMFGTILVIYVLAPLNLVRSWLVTRVYTQVNFIKTLFCSFQFNKISFAGIKNYKCKTCNKAFYKVSYLNAHIKTVHFKQKKYKCNQCDKEFSNSSNLNCHYRIHTGS